MGSAVLLCVEILHRPRHRYKDAYLDLFFALKCQKDLVLCTCVHTLYILFFFGDDIRVVLSIRSDLHFVNILDELVARVASLETRLLSFKVVLGARIAEGMTEAWEKESSTFAKTLFFGALEII